MGRGPLGEKKERAIASTQYFSSSHFVKDHSFSLISFQSFFTSPRFWVLTKLSHYNAGPLGISFSPPSTAIALVHGLTFSYLKRRDGSSLGSHTASNPLLFLSILFMTFFRSIFLKHKLIHVNSQTKIIQWLPIGCRINSTL